MAGGTVRGMTELTETEVKMLAFERQWWKYAGAKEQAILDATGLSAPKYYAALNALLDDPEALAADPLTVRRLRRIRERRAERSVRRVGFRV